MPCEEGVSVMFLYLFPILGLIGVILFAPAAESLLNSVQKQECPVLGKSLLGLSILLIWVSLLGLIFLFGL